MKRHLFPTSPNAQRGLSLVELLVAMTIGLVVIGAGASAYLSVSTNTRHATAMARMTEDASLALNILRAHIAMAGYSRPIGKETLTEDMPNNQTRTREVMTRAFKGGKTVTGDPNHFIAGCHTPFANPKSKELNIADLTCISGEVERPDAIAVVYEADPDGTYPDASQKATDCLGNAVPVRNEAGATAQLFVASNKFYIDQDTSTGVDGLYCQGNGRNGVPDVGDTLPSQLAAQMIVENISDMKIWYGIAAAGPRADTPVAVAYLSADQVRLLAGTEKWSRVVSVRICVTVRSPQTIPVNANEQPTYVDCDGTVTPNPYLNATHPGFVRTFTSTVVLHNRIGTLNTSGT